MLLSENLDVKLADFGLAKVFSKHDDDMMQTRIGTPYYMAPEILKGDQYDERADLWSIGIMLFQLVCGRVPFPASNQKDL